MQTSETINNYKRNRTPKSNRRCNCQKIKQNLFAWVSGNHIKSFFGSGLGGDWNHFEAKWRELFVQKSPFERPLSDQINEKLKAESDEKIKKVWEFMDRAESPRLFVFSIFAWKRMSETQDWPETRGQRNHRKCACASWKKSFVLIYMSLARDAFLFRQEEKKDQLLYVSISTLAIKDALGQA